MASMCENLKRVYGINSSDALLLLGDEAVNTERFLSIAHLFCEDYSEGEKRRETALRDC